MLKLGPVANADSRSRELARQLVSHADADIRVAYLRHQLSNRPYRDAAPLIAHTLRGAQTRDSELTGLLDIRLQLAPLLQRRDLRCVVASPRGLPPALARSRWRVLETLPVY